MLGSKRIDGLKLFGKAVADVVSWLCKSLCNPLCALFVTFIEYNAKPVYTGERALASCELSSHGSVGGENYVSVEESLNFSASPLTNVAMQRKHSWISVAVGRQPRNNPLEEALTLESHQPSCQLELMGVSTALTRGSGWVAVTYETMGSESTSLETESLQPG